MVMPWRFFLLLVSISPITTSVSSGETTDERNLAVMLHPSSRHVYVVPPDRPHCFVEHMAVEGFSCRNWKEIPDSGKGAWVPDRLWTWNDDGTLTCTGQVAENVPYRMTLSTTPKYIESNITVTNSGQLTFRDLYAHMCLNARRTRLLHDPDLHRTFVQIGEQRRAMAKTDTSRSLQGVMPMYFLSTVPAADRWMPDAQRDYGWAISEDVIESPLVAIQSTDCKWVAGMWFEPIHHVVGNSRNPPHGCVHSEPSFGTLEPGESASAVGRLYVQAGSIDDVWQQMTRDWQQARSARETK